MSGKNYKREEIYDLLNNTNKSDDCTENSEFLNDLKNKDDELHKLGCNLPNIYRYANLLLTSINNPNMCAFMNDWLNEKKIEHTLNGKNYEKNGLWEKYIEKVWIILEENSDPEPWCTRIHPSSSTTMIVSFTPFESLLHSKMNRIKRIKQNIYKEVSQDKFGDSHEYLNSNTENQKINIRYHSAQNS
ncbi:hypothetical protein POVWA2_062170 [Plasmodium ovale wallikeri]|uniref:PIR Superfamily Protein n=2 Tax=Plasmodium ovale TaxID=36330 RepID=A0A1A9A5W0_PLAOA|nr:hypothetical protein POVWA2_062170 [Plasmodium ovale wallikeri]SBT54046.1 hypothetical protein POVWA1_065500 [Plasmodium ovale wallikeri]SBT76565.1 hypothetical protein POWCR01_080006100 [Plasmodium ovale]